MDTQGSQPPEGDVGADNTAATGDPSDWLPVQSQSCRPGEDPSTDAGRNAMERPSGASLRVAFRTQPTNGGGSTVRAVTPDIGDGPESAAASSDAPHHHRELASHEASPRSVPGGVNRRQGVVFNDPFSDPYESSESSPPRGGNRLNSVRPRTRTMDTAMLSGQRAISSALDQRHRVGSVSASSTPTGDESRQPAAGLESTGFPTIVSGAGRVAMESTTPNSSRHDKRSNRKLVKRQTSRPTSPHVAALPSIDALPFPIPTESPQKMALLMTTLCGKMRGEIEYQGGPGSPWYTGVAYIDDARGCLMFDSGQNGPFHIPLVADLRGCRVLPVDYPEAGRQCLELVSSNPVIEFLLNPLVPGEFDLWVAALLCWQQLRPSAPKLAGNTPAGPGDPVRPQLARRGISGEGAKPSAIIKIGKLKVWDKGPASNPRSLVRRSSTRDPRSPQMSWRPISCIMQDNGEVKIMAENDDTVLAILALAHLSRFAIQQLDRSVLDEEYCLAIFPMYSAQSTRISAYRPIYLALDNRVDFEVWFALLRAFALPDVYKLDGPQKDEVQEVDDLEKSHDGEVFRVEKTILVRVTEAKIRAKTAGTDGTAIPEKNSKALEPDPAVGNYLAEVILDGEVRARTTVKPRTKNPFWREDCEFTELPSTIPQLSVVLKHMEGASVDATSHHSSSRSDRLNEVICGTVELPLTQTVAGIREHEEWLKIIDDRQASVGSMLVKVVHEEHIILLAKEYKPLGDALHNFNSGLTTLISAALPTQLRRLAEIFLNIFQVSGSANDWLMALVEDEIDGIGSQSTMKKMRFNSRLKSNESTESTSDRELILRDMNKSLTGEANLLFRGNTLLTQSLELHMRRLGKEFLEETLQEKLFEINELNEDCEVDPSKIPQASGELEQHWGRLIELTTEVWECIAASAFKMNVELRGILKYIRAVAEDRYGDFLRSVSYTSVSGFLFLRFICPAILSPKLFGLLRDHPRPRAQRTFTLIAKALQKLSNLSTFGKREEWMEPMNRFLNVRRAKFRDYIDQVCDVPAERGLRALHASYRTPMTIMSRLNATASEGFPSLPFLIDQSRNYASLVKLWVELQLKGGFKIPIEGELLNFSNMCKSLQERADACLATHERLVESKTDDTAPDELADILEQASLIESLSYAHGGSSVWNDQDHLPDSSGSDSHGDLRSKDTIDVLKMGGSRLGASNAGGSVKNKNGKKSRMIFSGIMRRGGAGRMESPDVKDKK